MLKRKKIRNIKYMVKNMLQINGKSTNTLLKMEINGSKLFRSEQGQRTQETVNRRNDRKTGLDQAAWNKR